MLTDIRRQAKVRAAPSRPGRWPPPRCAGCSASAPPRRWYALMPSRWSWARSLHWRASTSPSRTSWGRWGGCGTTKLVSAQPSLACRAFWILSASRRNALAECRCLRSRCMRYVLAYARYVVLSPVSWWWAAPRLSAPPAPKNRGSFLVPCILQPTLQADKCVRLA